MMHARAIEASARLPTLILVAFVHLGLVSLLIVHVRGSDGPVLAADGSAVATVAVGPAAEEPKAAVTKPATDVSGDMAAIEPPAARVLTVPLPLAGSVDTALKRQIDQVLSTVGRGTSSRPLLVLEFRGARGQAGEGSEFERCLSLARYLASERLAGIRTVAFVPGTLRGHAVLAVLACEEIVIAEEARFGSAGINETFIDETIRGAYREIAERRRTIPAAVAMGMLDQQLTVYKAQTPDGASYVLEDELQRLQRQTAVTSVETVSRAGDLAEFTGHDLRVKYGFVSHLASDRRQLAGVLRLAPGTLQQDPSARGGGIPLQIDVNGPINGKQVNWIERTLRERIASGEVNFVCVVIDSAGGAPQDSVRLANTLAALDPATVRTVAFVQRQARGDAALIALGCDQLVMAEDAWLGGAGESLFRDRELEALRSSLMVLAETRGRDWSLMAAMIDSDLAVYRYTKATTGETRYFCEPEWNGQPDPSEWSQGALIETRDGLSGRSAEELQLVQFLASNMDEIQRLYHVDGKLEHLQPNWAHLLIERLASPRLAGFLLFVAWFALMIEFSQPGVGLPGFIAAVCFVLYFWANFLHGTAGWLEVLLFVAGVTSVLVELFLLPGLGVFGIGGGMLIIGSIVLASQTFVVPRNSYQLNQLPGSLMMVAAAGAGAFAAMILVRRYLPEAPVLKRIMLAPPDEEELEDREEREALIHLHHLLGKRGRTVTPLMPSGKASFGDELVNVATSGESISTNVDIIAVADRGNYLLVEVADDEHYPRRR